MGNVETVRYYDTQQECLVNKYKLEKEVNKHYIYDCWVRKVKE